MENSLGHSSDHENELDIQRRKELFAYEMTEVRRMLEGQFKKYTPEQMDYAGSGTEEKTMPSVQKVFTEENPVGVSGTVLPEHRKASVPVYGPAEAKTMEVPELAAKQLPGAERISFEAEMPDISAERPGKLKMEKNEYSVHTAVSVAETLRFPEKEAADVRVAKPEAGLEAQKKLNPGQRPAFTKPVMSAADAGTLKKLWHVKLDAPADIAADVSTGASRRLDAEIARVTESDWKYRKPTVSPEETGRAEHGAIPQIRTEVLMEISAFRKLDAEISAGSTETEPVTWEEQKRLSVPEQKSAKPEVSLEEELSSRRLILQEYGNEPPVVRVSLAAVRGLQPDGIPKLRISPIPEVSAAETQDYGSMKIMRDAEAQKIWMSVGEIRPAGMPESHPDAGNAGKAEMKAFLPKAMRLDREKAEGTGIRISLAIPETGTLKDIVKTADGGKKLSVSLHGNGRRTLPMLNRTVPAVGVTTEEISGKKGLVPLPAHPVRISGEETVLPGNKILEENAGVTDWKPDVQAFRVQDLPPVEETISEIEAIRKEILNVPRGLSYEEICAQYEVPMPRLEIGGMLSEILDLVRQDMENSGKTT